MNEKQLFKRHHSRLAAEGIIKSALFGFMIGFAANFMMAFFAWFFDFGGIWLAIGVGIGAAVISAVLLYFFKLKPCTQDVARRVDKLGLEERVITMLELKDEESVIASLQRENAKAHLNLVNEAGRKIKIRLPKVLIVLTLVAVIFGSSMTTVVGLAESGVLPPGSELVDPEDPLENYIPVTYLVEGDEGGYIEGEPDQLVELGGTTTPVVAVAEDGWIFTGWDDGHAEPERSDSDIKEERVYIAIFEVIEEGDGEGEGDDSGNSGEQGSQEGDSAEDLPENGDANVDSENSGDAGDKGDGSGASSDNDGGQGSTEEEGEGKGDGQGLGAGGKWQDSNQFIDGKTYYKDQLDLYYQMALMIFEETGEIPSELREFFEAYYDSI